MVVVTGATALRPVRLPKLLLAKLRRAMAEVWMDGSRGESEDSPDAQASIAQREAIELPILARISRSFGDVHTDSCCVYSAPGGHL